jgi:hypothetical protein
MSPYANLEFKVHEHLEFKSMQEFYNRLRVEYYSTEKSKKLSDWYDADRCPSITIKVASVEQEKVFLYPNRISLLWETKEEEIEKRTRFEIKAMIGNRSPAQQFTVLTQHAAPDVKFSLRNFCIIYNPKDPPTFQFDKNMVTIEMHSAVSDRGVIMEGLSR